MSKVDFDTVVKSAASHVTESDVRVSAVEVECQIQGRAWNMNQPLNMIAYEDQK